MVIATNRTSETSDRPTPPAVDNQHGNVVLFDPRPADPAQEVTGEMWRFVLFVGPASNGPPMPFVLHRMTSYIPGPGATVLNEPVGPHLRIQFDLPAPTWAEAIRTAVREAESVSLRVLRVEHDDWVTRADVADRVGRCRETVRQWAGERAVVKGFPPPANPRRDTTFYSWAEVSQWLRERRKIDLPEEEPTLVAASLAVQLRALLPRIPRSDAILDLLDEPYRPHGPVGES